jgi:hypothetical protein
MKRKIARISIVVSALAVALSTGSAAGAATWLEMSPLPEANAEMASAVIEGKILAAGGYTAGRNTLFIYDPAADEWSVGPDLPVPTNHAAGATVGGRFYVFGGTEFGSSTVQIYDPATGSWSLGADMPSSRTAMAAVAVNGKIHVIGGSNDIMRGLVVNAHEVYDPVADSWEIKVAPPVVAEHLGAAVIDGEIYVVGGRANLDNVRQLAVYDPAADSWRAGPPPPESTSGAGVTAYGGRLYVYGGEEIGASLGALRLVEVVQRYHPAEERWEILDSTPIPLHGVAAETVGHGLYFMGGSQVSASNTPTDYVVCLRFASEGDSSSRPARPRRLAAEVLSPSEVRLTWQDESTNEISFLLQMRIPGVSRFRDIAEVSADTTTAVVSELDPGTTHVFRVRAIGEVKRSRFSNRVRVTLPAGMSMER